MTLSGWAKMQETEKKLKDLKGKQAAPSATKDFETVAVGQHRIQSNYEAKMKELEEAIKEANKIKDKHAEVMNKALVEEKEKYERKVLLIKSEFSGFIEKKWK